MNQIAWQIYGGSNRKANTFIGGVASTITTSGALATKLGIASNRITNFKIVGSDIECRIIGSYGIPPDAFRDNNIISYYRDSDGLVSSISNSSFLNTTNTSGTIEFKNLLTAETNTFYNSRFSHYILENITSLGFNFFAYNTSLLYYIPRCTNLGGTSGNNTIFFGSINSNVKIYCHPSLATNNAGAPDGDLAYAISQGAIVRYVTSFTAPSPITNLSIGNVYGTAVQLNFTAPTGSTNAIEFYEVYVNGVYNKTVTASGQYITGLTLNTAYTIEVKPVDIFYNKSTSNIISATTANPSYTDTDANAYISAATLISSEQESAYQLITDLKTAGLWTKIQAIYPFKGTTATQHKWNAKNPLDTNAAFRLTFSGSGTFSNLGYQLNGTNAFANTNLVNNVVQTINNQGATVVVGTNNAVSVNGVELGSFQNPNGVFLSVKRISGGRKDVYYGTTLTREVGIDESRCVFTGTRTGSNVVKMYKNGALIGTGSGSGTMSSLPYDIGRLSSDNGQYSPQRIQITIIHEGLSDAEVATLHAIIDTSETIAGRKTW